MGGRALLRRKGQDWELILCAGDGIKSRDALAKVGIPLQDAAALERETDQTKRLQLGDEIQKVALSEVTYVPWGEWVQPTAFRKSVRDVLKFGAPLFWNVKVA
jgi:hypothetical protein